MIDEIRHLSSGASPPVADTRFCILTPANLVAGSLMLVLPAYPVCCTWVSQRAALVPSPGEGNECDRVHLSTVA
ncbi:hypothetical protein DEI81_08480 [Curtobacterium sp. MCBD17_013]|nr:hypothetical protein DEI81_08480 [Curtobacterium sp. MCBD17_013]